MKRWILAVLAVLALLTGCGAAASDDRSDAVGGGEPDGYADLTHVVVYRAPDEVPNIALVCTGDFAFAVTLNSTTGRGQLERQADLDGPWCGRKPG